MGLSWFNAFLKGSLFFLYGLFDGVPVLSVKALFLREHNRVSCLFCYLGNYRTVWEAVFFSQGSLKLFCIFRGNHQAIPIFLVEALKGNRYE